MVIVFSISVACGGVKSYLIFFFKRSSKEPRTMNLLVFVVSIIDSSAYHKKKEQYHNSTLSFFFCISMLLFPSIILSQQHVFSFVCGFVWLFLLTSVPYYPINIVIVSSSNTFVAVLVITIFVTKALAASWFAINIKPVSRLRITPTFTIILKTKMTVSFVEWFLGTTAG